jgi:hypothetical protein
MLVLIIVATTEPSSIPTVNPAVNVRRQYRYDAPEHALPQTPTRQALHRQLRPLKNTHQQQQQRRNEAHRGISWQQADGKRRYGHQQNAERKHLLTSDQIAKVCHHNAAQRTCKIPGRKNAKGLHLAQPFRNICREEQLPTTAAKKTKMMKS